MELNQDDHRQPGLNLDVLRYVCNCLTDVSAALSFSLTCSALRKGALQRRLGMAPVVLSNCESVDGFHRFIFADAAAWVPYIYGLNLAAFCYNVENENARRRSEVAKNHLVALLESATHLQCLHIPTTVGDCVLTAAAKVVTLRELFVLSERYHEVRLHWVLGTLRSPLRYLHIEAFESDGFYASFLHSSLAHLAPTLEILELEDFYLDLPPSSVTTPFTAMRTLKTKAISFVSRLDVLWWLFPNLDTLVVDHLDKRFTEDDYPASRERSKEAQETCSWAGLDRVVCEADLAFLMALQCPIRRMDVTVLHQKQLRYLTETLRHNCPRWLRLSLSFDDGLYALDGLFPPEVEDKLTHFIMFADIDVETEWSGRPRDSISWTLFMDRLTDSMSHLPLTHLRVVFHYQVRHTVSNETHPDAASGDDSSMNTVRETDLHPAVQRLFDTISTVQYVFLTTCSRFWVWTGSYVQVRNKWSLSKAWRAEGLHPPGTARGPCLEISIAEAEAVMKREELQLSQREAASGPCCAAYRG